ncbi:cation:dicarboxylase symporter family transporter [Micromonospora sp. WMMA1998]|uniref:cation:dicarboxylate symporter family transporter n=1 Tax=Micromonospora sp. WMMA1998 TaxID=3015167 RepID=UPI00248B35AF|nr:cation:dicarboxylase symporter family transporter [Micromonospora sp. WMMA1998]WBC15247.1 cation:dicarboxylase symporter family transporter [Micromonospora sp. WMMA1998]WBC15273.1 cation:dicarboxylase symporter family transporter [Micromonospora sp. WMMA1998]
MDTTTPTSEAVRPARRRRRRHRGRPGRARRRQGLKPLGTGFVDLISLLVFMVIASKGAAGVTGAGLATLAGGLQSHRPDLVDGVGLIVGIDRFMSEARALTNFAGDAMATVLVGTWTGEFDRDRARAVLAGDRPFDEATMVDENDDERPADDTPPGAERPLADSTA